VTPLVEKPHRVVYVRRGGRDGYPFEIALTAASNTARVELGLTGPELRAIAGCYHYMEYNRALVTAVEDPNVYETDTPQGTDKAPIPEPSNGMTFEQWFDSSDLSHDPATRHDCQLAWIAAKRSGL
jgi:hypothetical protein